MNEVMSLDQLEKLAKNPAYKMSEAQVRRLEELRSQRYETRKHDYTIRKHDPIVKEPSHGADRG